MTGTPYPSMGEAVAAAMQHNINLAWKDTCGAFWNTDGGLVVCSKSDGHTSSKDPQRREHYDVDKDVRWSE